MNPTDISLHIAAVLAFVVGIGTLLSPILKAFGQPRVIGEIVAGIILGPSVLGYFWPEALHWLLPGPDVDSRGTVLTTLKSIAELGAVLYMFIVGTELEGSEFRRQAKSTLVITNAGILLPFLLGFGLALLIHSDRAPARVSETSLSLFLGAALSITAFPVLARILTDRGMEKTELGIRALCCAATGDAIAWCLLAVVVGFDGHFRFIDICHQFEPIVYYLIGMALIVRPIVRWLANFSDASRCHFLALPILGIGLFLSASATAAIGLHAVFGAFLLGVLVPCESRLARNFIRIVRRPTTVLLLPAFFAVAGLNTRIGLLSRWEDWSLCHAIIAVAVIGKFGGTLVAARGTGLTWRTSAALGALMNTRGLMELIVLNIGLQMGIITPALFAMMVLMALVTTAATAPLLGWLVPKSPTILAEPDSQSAPLR